MKIGKTLTALSAVLALTLANNAMAITAAPLFVGPPFLNDLMEDDDAVTLINNGGGARILDVGDVLWGHLNITSVNTTATAASGGLVPDGSQFTMELRLKVTAKVLDGDDNTVYTMGPDATWPTAIAMGLAGEAMVVAWLDAGPPLTIFDHVGTTAGTVAGAIASSTDGMLQFAVGIPAESAFGDEYYHVVIKDAGAGLEDDMDVVNATSAVTSLGDSYFNLEKLGVGIMDSTLRFFDAAGQNTTSDALGGGSGLLGGAGFTGHFSGTSALLGGGGSLFDSTSDAQIEVNAVPTPAAAYAGLAMLGALAAARIKRRA
jgi:hypothetical protein